MQNLKYLDLSSNDMGREGANVVSASLKKLPNIEWLNLSDNNIGVTGAGYLAKAFEDGGKFFFGFPSNHW